MILILLLIVIKILINLVSVVNVLYCLTLSVFPSFLPLLSKDVVAGIVRCEILELLDNIMAHPRRAKTIPGASTADIATSPEFKGITNISTPGGLQNQQSHYDWFINQKRNTLIPYFVIFSVMHGSCLDLHWKDPQQNQAPRRLVLNAGDLVLFDGYKFHRGSNYDQFNLRIFGYYPTQANTIRDEVHYAKVVTDAPLAKKGQT
jgi:hypothetical protein